MNNSVKYGLYAGLLMGAISLAIHFAMPNLRANSTLGLVIGYGVPLIFMVLAVKAERAHQEGLISFGEALKTSFLVFLIAIIISSIVSYILFQLYTESDWQSIVDMQRDMQQGMFDMMGADQSMIDEAMDELTIENIRDTISSPGMMVLGLLMNSIFGIIISLIVSAIMKKNPTV